MDYVIGVDIGTQSTKALLVDQHGAIVAQHASSYQPDTPRPLWAGQWPAVWLNAVVECVAACVDKAKAAGVAAKSIKAVCVSSLYGGSGIPVDSEMRPLYPCLIWMDRRATDQVEWVRANIDLERLYAITGNGVDSYYGYTKMLWLRDHEPEVWAHTRYFLPPNAYVIYMLTGEVAVDHSSAGNIGGIYDIAKRDWSDEALDMLGIPATMMPERLVESSDVVGGLLSQWTGQLGLEAGRKGAQSLDDKLIVVGGAAHSDLWMQIIADVTGYPVYTIEQDVEAAMGAALLAGVGVGLVSREEAQRGWVTLVERAEPNAQRMALYEQRFGVYTDLYPALKSVMHRLQIS